MDGDMNDTGSLTRALDGVQGVYAVQTFYEQGAEAEANQGKQLIDAARQQGVSHIVYSSAVAVDQNTDVSYFQSKAQVEEHLRASGLTYTILRPVYFMENWLTIKEMLDQGFLAWPSNPSTKLQQIAVDDIGFFAADAFHHPERWKNRAVEIAGDDLTWEESAATLGEAVGRRIEYRQIPWQAFEQRMGPDLTKMFRWFEDHPTTMDIPKLREIHPKLLTFKDWLKTWPT